jgi:hypothetical protein
VDPHNEHDVTEALDLVLREPARRAHFVAAGRELAARHSWSQTAIRTRELLSRAAEAEDHPA